MSRYGKLVEPWIQNQADVNDYYGDIFNKSEDRVKRNVPHYDDYSPSYQYIYPYEEIRFDDAPDPIYGFTIRTRQVFPCQRNVSNECDALEANGRVVECKQNRFMLVYYRIKLIVT